METASLKQQLARNESVRKTLEQSNEQLKKKMEELREKLIRQDSFSPLLKEIFANEMENATRLPNNRQYSKAIYDFALCQQYHSNAGM